MPTTGDKCARCRATLSRHQPDPLWPEALLLTCPSCRSWYVRIDHDLIAVPMEQRTSGELNPESPDRSPTPG